MNKKNGNRRIGAGLMGRGPSSAERGGICGELAVDIDRAIKGTCRSFARAADWRSGDSETGYRLSEDHEGLHSGRYINVSVLRAANAVSIRGGYYDGYWQPRTVYRESIPLKEFTAHTLGCLLMEMHDRLCNGH